MNLLIFSNFCEVTDYKTNPHKKWLWNRRKRKNKMADMFTYICDRLGWNIKHVCTYISIATIQFA